MNIGEAQKLFGKSQKEFVTLRELNRRRRARIHMENMHNVGEILSNDASRVYVAPYTVFQGNAALFAGVELRGENTIGKDVVIEQGTIVTDSVIENGVEIGPHNVITCATIHCEARIGSHNAITEHSIIGAHTEVEYGAQIKRSVIGDHVKVYHTGQFSDVEIGEKTNVGAFTKIGNHDKRRKRRTVIGNRCYLGIGSTYIGPLIMGDEVCVWYNLGVKSKTLIPGHTWVMPPRDGYRDFYPGGSRSFKIPGHWIWITTKKPVTDLNLMSVLLAEFGLSYSLKDLKEMCDEEFQARVEECTKIACYEPVRS